MRLGSGNIACECGKKVEINATMKYLYPCAIKLQSRDKFVMRSAPWNLPLAESLMGLLFRFGVRELKRESVTIEGKEFIDIHVVKG